MAWTLLKKYSGLLEAEPEKVPSNYLQSPLKPQTGIHF